MHLFNYAEGISRQDGDNWYLTKHVPAVKKLPGIVRYRSWKQWDAGIPYPSPGAPTPFDQFVRRTELCFANDEQGIKTVYDNPQLWEPSARGVPGFREFECMFLTEDPEFNLLQDAPYPQYKYMTLPLWWPKGRPTVNDNEPIFIDSYCILYAPGVSFQDGEDWYLGHHTREGKQLPGMRHYRTWRVVPVPEPPAGSTIKPNKWNRLTELGMSPANYKATMVNEETRIRFTPSPVRQPGVLGGWLNISIKLDQFDEFVAQK
jgi:hypothetical protein